MIPKIIVGLIILIMIFVSFSPLNLGIFYLFVRPLVQGFAHAGYKLMPGMPLTGSLTMFFIVFSTATCLLRKGYRVFLPTIIPLYLLLFFSVLSFLNTVDYIVSVSHILKIGSGIAMYFLIYNSINSQDDAKKVLYAVVLSAVMLMIFGYYQALDPSIRIDGFTGQPNAYGIFLSVTFCAALMLLLQSNKRSHQIFIICVMASMIVSMILARNRGQWIALFSGHVIAYLGYMDKIKLRNFLIPGVLIAIIFSGMILERFGELHEQTPWGRTKNTLDSRRLHWKRSMTLFIKHPLIGNGIGTATKLAGIHYGNPVPPHNDYVRLLEETGIMGCLLYLIFLFSLLFKYVKLIFNKKNWFINYPMLVLIIYWIIHSCVQNIIFNVFVFPIFMTIAAVSTKLNLFKPAEDSY